MTTPLACAIFHRAVAGGVVHHDHFVRLQHLRLDAGERFTQSGFGIVQGDDHGKSHGRDCSAHATCAAQTSYSHSA